MNGVEDGERVRTESKWRNKFSARATNRSSTHVHTPAHVPTQLKLGNNVEPLRNEKANHSACLPIMPAAVAK